MHQIQLDGIGQQVGCLSLEGFWESVWSEWNAFHPSLPGGLLDEGHAYTLSLWPSSADSPLVPLVLVF